jgi:glycosyltransferase involved in cell wall biosynthesis
LTIVVDSRSGAAVWDRRTVVASLVPVRILHTVEFYAPSVGGAQEVVRQLSVRLAARGHDVTVATTRLPERTTDMIDGVRIAGFDVRGNAVRGIDGEVALYREFAAGGEWDVVMSYAAEQWATDALLPIVHGLPGARVLAPCGFSRLDSPEYAGFYTALPAQMAAYDALVFHSTTYQDVAFARQHGLQNIEVISNGADEREFDLDPDEIAGRRARFRAKYRIAPDEPLLLTVGGHTGHKGHALVLAALTRLRVPATLALVGNQPLGIGCGPSCRVRAAGANLVGRGRRRALLLDPPRDEVIDAYFASDLFVFGSEFECSPLVLFEAAAAGLPFLTVPAGNGAEIAEWTGGGAVVHAPLREGLVKGEPVALAEATRALLGDPDRRAAMSAAARAAWRERYSWDRITDRYEALYERVASRRRFVAR